MSLSFLARLSSCLLLISLLGSCNNPAGRDQTGSQLPVIAKAEIRYLSDLEELSADLRLFRGNSLKTSQAFRPPEGSVSFLGSAMQAKNFNDHVRWRSRMKAGFPEKLRFTFPLDSLAPQNKTTLNLEFSKIVADSIPPTIDKNARPSFYTGRQRLQSGESIVVFFEPEDRGAKVRRVIVAGPSKSNYVTLPAESMSQIAPGPYSVYLVKQAISRDTLPGLVSAVTFQYHTRSREVRVVE